MSTIKTTYLQHPSSGSPNLTLAADGSVSGGAGLGGLVHIATESFSGVSSVSLDGCFSSDYQNYCMVIKCDNSAGAEITFKMRASGADNSSNYLTAWNMSTSGGIEDFASFASGGRTTGFLHFHGSAGSFGLTHTIFDPFAATPTLVVGTGISTQMTQGTTATYHNVSTAFDGLSLIASAGNITGTIRIYGYKD